MAQLRQERCKLQHEVAGTLMNNSTRISTRIGTVFTVNTSCFNGTHLHMLPSECTHRIHFFLTMTNDFFLTLIIELLYIKEIQCVLLEVGAEYINIISVGFAP
jgi:hypothetical protein